MSRFRLPDWLGGHDVEILSEDSDGVWIAVKFKVGQCKVPRQWLEPVGLDMAEPDDGTIVLIERKSGSPVLGWRRDRDPRNPGNPVCRWHVAGIIYAWPNVLLDAVSITVLVPRDDDLRTRLAAARDEAGEKADNITSRHVVGTTHAYYRDVMHALLHDLPAAGFSINGRTQADSGE